MAAAAFLLAALPLAACSAPPPAMPAVVWKDGKAPSGAYENSTWVKAARAAQTALNAAHNAADYRMEELRLVDGGLITADYLGAKEGARKDEYLWYLGPQPADVLSVTVSKDKERATVVMCVADNWYITKDHPDVPTRLVASKSAYEMIAGGKDIGLSGLTGAEGTCTLTNPAIGYFKPAPDVTKTPKVSDIKRAPDQ